MRRLVDEIAAREDRTVDLFGKLRHITPVDEDDRLRAQNHCNACRAGEARQPGQALRTCGNIFAVELVGARHKKGVDLEGIESSAQRRYPIPAELGRGGDFEGLEHVARPDQPLLDTRDPALLDPGKADGTGAAALFVRRLEVNRNGLQISTRIISSGTEIPPRSRPRKFGTTYG